MRFPRTRANCKKELDASRKRHEQRQPALTSGDYQAIKPIRNRQENEHVPGGFQSFATSCLFHDQPRQESMEKEACLEAALPKVGENKKAPPSCSKDVCCSLIVGILLHRSRLHHAVEEIWKTIRRRNNETRKLQRRMWGRGVNCLL